MSVFKPQLHHLPAVDIEKIIEILRASVFPDNQCEQKELQQAYYVWEENSKMLLISYINLVFWDIIY